MYKDIKNYNKSQKKKITTTSNLLDKLSVFETKSAIKTIKQHPIQSWQNTLNTYYS